MCRSRIELIIMMIEIIVWNWGLRLGDWEFHIIIEDLDLVLGLEIGIWYLGLGVGDLDWRLGFGIRIEDRDRNW